MINAIKTWLTRRKKRKAYERACDVWLELAARKAPDSVLMIAAKRVMKTQRDLRGDD